MNLIENFIYVSTLSSDTLMIVTFILLLRECCAKSLTSITKFLESKIKLKVNLTKSDASSVQDRKFLGFTLLTDGSAIIARESISRFNDKVRLITKRNRGVKFDTIINLNYG